MPFDLQDGFPDDWHVPPSAQGDGFPDDWHVPPSAQGDGFPDDWHVPPSAQGNGFPNDWFVPPSAALDVSQATSSPEPDITGSLRANRTPSPEPQPPFFPSTPGSRAGMDAWGEAFTSGEFGQFPQQQTRPSALPPLSAGGDPFGSFASSQPATNMPPFAASSLLSGATAPPPKSDDASAYSMLFGEKLPPKSDASDAPSPTPAPNGPYSATLLPALDNLDQSSLGPRRLMVSSEGGEREDDERRKFETPEVIGGLSEPGLGSPKQPPTLPSIPPLDVPPTWAEVWGLAPTKRGRILEPLFGHNLHPNYPTVDIWDPESGSVTSLKSIDLRSSTYQVEGNSPNALYKKLSGYLNDLAEFEHAEYADIMIPKGAVKSRTLTVIVPNEGTPTQREVMQRIIEVGRQRGVVVNFRTHP